MQREKKVKNEKEEEEEVIMKYSLSRHTNIYGLAIDTKETFN